MKSMVSVMQERRIAATPAEVWHVITTPGMHERLDPRCHLASATGNGDAGSEFVLDVRAGLTRARLRYVIREAIPQTRWVAEIDRAGRHAGTHHAELRPEATGTLLRWTVNLPAARLARRLVTASCRRELDKWLTAVAHHSRPTPSGPAGV